MDVARRGPGVAASLGKKCGGECWWDIDSGMYLLLVGAFRQISMTVVLANKVFEFC